MKKTTLFALSILASSNVQARYDRAVFKLFQGITGSQGNINLPIMPIESIEKKLKEKEAIVVQYEKCLIDNSIEINSQKNREKRKRIEAQLKNAQTGVFKAEALLIAARIVVAVDKADKLDCLEVEITKQEQYNILNTKKQTLMEQLGKEEKTATDSPDSANVELEQVLIQIEKIKKGESLTKDQLKTLSPESQERRSLDSLQEEKVVKEQEFLKNVVEIKEQILKPSFISTTLSYYLQFITGLIGDEEESEQEVLKT